MSEKIPKILKRGWTTGSCATAAAKSACIAAFTKNFPDPVSITLPNNQEVSFCLATTNYLSTQAEAGVIKDAGDDPDVTHGALVLSKIVLTHDNTEISFKAGHGVGIITKPGLPLAVGEPAINPVPRMMINGELRKIFRQFQHPGGAIVTISIDNGLSLAQQTWNPRLGIVGGLSILGTTGIVVPFSCSAWVASIHRGVDVCRANKIDHAFACTGRTSEQGVQDMFIPPREAIIDMGDFVGGLLKYLRRNPIPRLTIAGGFAKISKLAAGFIDLHSGRSQIDRSYLAGALKRCGADKKLQELTWQANSALDLLLIAQQHHIALADIVAKDACAVAIDTCQQPLVSIDVMVFDRQAKLIGRSTIQ